MQIKNSQKRHSFYARITNSRHPVWSLQLLTSAEEWANRMEARMAEGEPLANVAEQTYQSVILHTVEGQGLHELVCDRMVDYLVLCWVHGYELERWYKAHRYQN
jgi:hypothetical protein